MTFCLADAMHDGIVVEPVVPPTQVIGILFNEKWNNFIPEGPVPVMVVPVVVDEEGAGLGLAALHGN
jgi:hypothetical protein